MPKGLRGQMDINALNLNWRPFALLLLAAISGCCCQAYPLPGEDHCPTDARRLYLTCGEEAVRRCPCGPDQEFYGLKPTNWRAWPEGWQCGPDPGSPCQDAGSCAEPVNSESASGEEFSNPFRSDAKNEELPQPPAPAAPPATQASPPAAPPVQPAPAKTTPLEMPSLELPPAEAAPAKPAPAESAPPAKPPVQAPPAKITPVETPPATITPVETPPATPKPVETPPAASKPAPPAPAEKTPPLNKPEVKTPAKSQSSNTGPRPPAPKALASNQTKHAVPLATAHATVEKTNQHVPQPAKPLPAERQLSERVEQHLFNNLQL